MKITTVTQIKNILITVTPAKAKIGEIVGFVELQFLDENESVLIIGRGYTIKVKIFSNIPTFTVNAPAYRSAGKWRTSFVIESKSLWHDITKAILDDFSNQIGGLKPEDYISEEVDPNDIPF